jgi:hypothetical protein
MAILDNLFGAPPEYLTGLLAPDQTDKLRKQAMTTGLINSAIALIAQPRNQRYGSALPYIGKALMAGQQAGQSVYSNALQGLETQQKLAEFKRQQEQRAAQQQYLKTLPENIRGAAMAFPEVGGEYAKSLVKTPEIKTATVGNVLVNTQTGQPIYTAPQETKPRATREVDAGNKVLIVDSITGETLREIPKGLAPQAPQRASYSTVTGGDGQVYRVNSLTGQAEPVSVSGTNKPLTGATGGAKASEGERKAATLLKRITDSSKQLENVTNVSPNAQKPGLIASGLESLPFGIGNVPANALKGADRQRVEAAQLDILDAGLTLSTGAAYTREQLEGFKKSYFPQINDDPNTILDKQDRLNSLIESAKIAAGSAYKEPTQFTGEQVNLLPKNAPMPNTGFKIRKVR